MLLCTRNKPQGFYSISSVIEELQTQVSYPSQQFLQLVLVLFISAFLSLLQLLNYELQLIEEVFEARGHRLIETAMDAVFCLSPTELL